MLREETWPLRLRAAAAALAPALALAAAALATAAFQLDRGAAVTTAAFGWLALGVLGALALLPGLPGALPAAAALATGLALLGLPHLGVLRPAVTIALLAAAVVAHAGAALRRPGPLGAGAWFALALAAQLVVAAEHLFLAPTAPATAALLVGLPLVAGLALDRIERAAGRELAIAAALAAFIAGPGLPLAAAGALAIAALLAVAAGRRPQLRRASVVLVAGAPFARGPEPTWLALAVLGVGLLASGTGASGRRARRALVALALGTTLAAALPWRRTAPAATLLGAFAAPPGRAELRAVEIQPVVLTAATPRFTVELDGAEAGGVVVDSYLTRAVELSCGTPLARIRLELAAGGSRETALEIGRDSAEWAAERADVAAALACPAPPAWTSWLPAGGGFLGHHYRARLRLPRPLAARRLTVERSPELPEATAVALFNVAIER